MKINWGTAIVIAFGLFISFILFFVIKVQTDSKYDNELVVTDYYKQETGFDERYEKQQRALIFKDDFVFLNTDEGLQISFPKSLQTDKIKGKVSLYRPSNQKLDFEIPISFSSSHLLIPKSSLVDGRWDITLDFTYDGESYMFTKTIY
jgi:nitrogen fixation protein FixH